MIDLAADLRIKDIVKWEKLYGVTHASPDVVVAAEYGLREVNRDQIAKAWLVAIPGCYPSAVQLVFLPLIEAGAVDVARLIGDAKSGVSGAGRKADVHILFSEASDKFKVYGVPGERHLPAIGKGLSRAVGNKVGLTLRHILRRQYAAFTPRYTQD